MDGEPRGRRGLAEESGELDAADAVGADLLDGDAAAGELGGEKIAGVAQAASGDELALRIRARAGRNADGRVGARARGGEQDEDDRGAQRVDHGAQLWSHGRCTWYCVKNL
ncbi:MAG: hypothetical protein E6J91_01330 [Deltaproteobacteria bacterium]|nr:MAG: hypothetical protein E6J91_01330 [Deltaproteobacteria bacterium]